MRYSAIALTLLLAVAAETQAQEVASKTSVRAPAATAQSSTERTLVRLEDDWTKALIRRDAAYFRRMLAPGFVYTEDAAVMNADEVIRGATTGTDRVEWAANQGMKVHDFGSTVVVTGILAIKGRGKDGAFNHRYRFTDTWQRRNGRWQIIAAQDYLMPK